MEKRAVRFLLALAGAFTLAAPGLFGQGKAPTQSFDLIDWNGGKFIYGVCYYPEHWDESQWEKDATMMEAAGINFVRLAEFAWVKMEPAEGRFDFAWLDRALKVLNAHGIKAVLGTPTGSPPAWLYAKYPDIAAMDKNGVRYRYGSRGNFCLHNPASLAATQRIVSAMAEHYRNHPGVLGWQIDNELGGSYCYDAACQRAFQKWCRNKFHTLDALNKAWGTIFWGHTYSAWTEIPLPWNTMSSYFTAYNPSLALDYARFHSNSTYDYLKLQVDILRRICPGKAITHNGMGMYDKIDYSRLNEELDFAAWDNYPMFSEDYVQYSWPGLAHDLVRGSKKNQNFMVMEEQSRLPGWATGLSMFKGDQSSPELIRVWAYQAVAHGADGVCYFRWRTTRYGAEQYWPDILDQDSYPNASYRLVSQTGKELGQLTDLLRGSRVASTVALLVSPDTRWASDIQTLAQNFSYDRQLRHFYSAFRRARKSVDVLFPQSDFTAYRVIVAPSLFVVDQALAEKLASFVKNGGTLVLTYRSGVKDENNVAANGTLPGLLAELAGVAIHDVAQTIKGQEVVETDGTRAAAGVWFDVLDPTTARALATYGKGYYAGKVAVTQNRFGQGTVFYVGTESSAPESYDRLVARAAEQAGISLGPRLPEGVELALREKSGKKIVFLLNYTESPQRIALDKGYRNALTEGNEPAEVEVPAFDVKVLVSP